MTCAGPELLHRYLAGEVDLAGAQALEEHLSQCPHCSDLLAQIAADDTALSGVFALDQSEEAWIRQTDLTSAILHQVTPWHRQASIYLLVLLALFAGSWALKQAAAALTAMLAWQGHVGLIIAFGRAAIPSLWQMAQYLLNGGLLATIWPLLLVCATLLGRRYLKKEVNLHA